MEEKATIEDEVTKFKDSLCATVDQIATMSTEEFASNFKKMEKGWNVPLLSKEKLKTDVQQIESEVNAMFEEHDIKKKYVDLKKKEISWKERNLDEYDISPANEVLLKGLLRKKELLQKLIDEEDGETKQLLNSITEKKQKFEKVHELLTK